MEPIEPAALFWLDATILLRYRLQTFQLSYDAICIWLTIAQLKRS